MKKFMRIALVFALAGAALMYTGCTKDYSGDISDLNKKVSEQASALSALQTQVAAAQSSASEALSSAQNALKEAQAAAKAAEAANNDAEVATLTTKIATIEGNIADLQAKVEALNGLEEKLNEVADQLKKDVDAKVDAALEEIQKELEKAIAQVEGNFSVEALPVATPATYASATWAPSNGKTEKENLAKLTKVFPELAELKKGDKVETFGHLDFIVNPSSVALDETYTFALIDKDGKDSKVVLGNPTKGSATKAGLNVWNIEVQSPAYNSQGAAETLKTELALVVENAAGVYAQTGFSYEVQNCGNGGTFTISAKAGNDTLKFDDTKSKTNFDAFKSLFTTTGVIYDNKYFVIEADPADVEKYGIEIEGSKISFTEAQRNGTYKIPFNITAVSVDGKTAAQTDSIFVKYEATIAPNAELAAKEIELGYKDGSWNVPVKYDFADFGFSANEKRDVFAALKTNGVKATAKFKDAYGAEHSFESSLVFYGSNGKPTGTTNYSEVAAFGFNVDSSYEGVVPGTYTVVINAGGVFCGKGELTIQNPEACPVKLIEALCKDGVLQIVGSTTEETGYIKYNLNNALVFSSHEADVVNNSFVDEDKANDEDSWVDGGTTFKVEAKKANLYTPRTFSVEFEWFGNENNKDTFEFKAQAVSPIYDATGAAVVVADQTIFIGGEGVAKGTPTSFKVSDIVTSAKYVAGDNVGDSYKVFSTWTGKKDPTAKYTYNYTEENYSTKNASTMPQASWRNVTDFVKNSRLIKSNDGEFITIPTTSANLLRGFGLNDDDILAAQNAETPLYLTKKMLEYAYEAGTTKQHGWAAFYDEYGDKLGGTIASAKDADNKQFTCGFFTAKFHDHFDSLYPTELAPLTKAEDIVDFYKNTAKDLFNEETTWTKAVKDTLNVLMGIEKLKVDAYNTIKDNFKTADGTYNDGAAAKCNEDRADEITKVTVEFADTTYAKKFVDKTSVTYPTKNHNIDEIRVSSSAFLAGLDSVELPAYIKIEDKWGMTMTKEFKVIVKSATK